MFRVFAGACKDLSIDTLTRFYNTIIANLASKRKTWQTSRIKIRLSCHVSMFDGSVFKMSHWQKVWEIWLVAYRKVFTYSIKN